MRWMTCRALSARPWDGGSGFGRIRRRVGFGWNRAESEQPRRVFLGIFCSLYGHFDPVKIDSGFGRIR